jgi:hypothetical protein
MTPCTTLRNHVELTPSKSDKLCPASARSDAEFIQSPASPFVAVRATLLPSPSRVILVPRSRFERVENLLGPLGVVVRVGMEQPAVLVLVLVLVAAVIVVVVVVVFPLG